MGLKWHRTILPRMPYLYCKCIQLQRANNINHIKASTCNIRRSFVSIQQNICQRKIQDVNTIQLNPYLFMTAQYFVIMVLTYCVLTTILFGFV